MVPMEIVYFTLGVFVSCLGATQGSHDTYNNGASCYDCHYAASGLTRNDRGRWVVNKYSGFPRCALAQHDDAYYVNKWSCESERCFIRKDPNGQIYRGCADKWNLPGKIDPGLNCSRQGSAIWWFCNGHLCNDGDLESDGRCGSLDEDTNDAATEPQGGFNPVTYDPPIAVQNAVENDDVRYHPTPSTPALEEVLSDPSYSQVSQESETVHGYGMYDSSDDDQYIYPYDETEEENVVIQDDHRAVTNTQEKYTSPSSTSRVNQYNYEPYTSQNRRNHYRAPTRPQHNYPGYRPRKVTPHPSPYNTNNQGNPFNNFWSWLWRSGGLQQLNPPQAYWRYLSTRTQPTPNYQSGPTYQQNQYHGGTYEPQNYQRSFTRNRANYPNTRLPSQNSYTKTTSAAQYGSDKSNMNNAFTPQTQEGGYSTFTAQSTYPWSDKPENDQNPEGAGSSSGSASNHNNVRLSIRPVEDGNAEDRRQEIVSSTHQAPPSVSTRRRDYTQHHSKYTHPVETTPAESDAYNPCAMNCHSSTGILLPDPNRADHFIQCGPGNRNGHACKCCHPNYQKCPQGTTYDHMHKGCNQVGSYYEEDRKYKTIDMY